MKKISKIYTYGTSFTQGGGFEFDVYNKHNNQKLNQFYKNFAPNEERTQFNFSWPGQLHKLLNISVINQAKSGYGLERLLRLSSKDILKEKKFNNLDKCLFLFEFPGLGRKEYWFEPIKDYIITNYHFKIKGYEDETHFVVWDDSLEYKTVTHGIADTYHRESDAFIDSLKENDPTIKKFNELTLNYKERLEEVSQKIISFLAFCEYYKINYFITHTPFLNEDFEYYYHGSPSEKKSIKYNGHCDLYGYIDKNKLQLVHETNGLINDNHGGLIANKNLAKIISDRIKTEYAINTI